MISGPPRILLNAILFFGSLSKISGIRFGFWIARSASAMRSYPCSNVACTACALRVTYWNACALRLLLLRKGDGVLLPLRKCILNYFCACAWFLSMLKRLHFLWILAAASPKQEFVGNEAARSHHTGERRFLSQVEIIEISSSSQRFRKRNCFVQVREGCGKVSFLNLEAFFFNVGIVQ